MNAPIEWEQYDVSGMSSSGEELFKQAMESLKRNRVGLKGAPPRPLYIRYDALIVILSSRYPLHADLPDWPHLVERRHAPAA